MTDPLSEFTTLASDRPVALLPVRIETRVKWSGLGTPRPTGDLMVRIYPDSILADSHEPLLTPNEVSAGQDYWNRAFRDGAEAGAWTALLSQATPERAGWIVDQTTPTNVADMPMSADASSVTPAFGDLPTRPEGSHRAPQARALPDRWVVSCFRGGQRVAQGVSAPVRDGLALTARLGNDPDVPPTLIDLSGDGLTVEPELKWAYDFDEATAAGMAVTIRLNTPVDLINGFETILVVGVRGGDQPGDGADELDALLTSHQFSRGLAFVAQGTRTNNTGDAPSDYPSADPAGAVSFAAARGPAQAVAGTDGYRLAGALGIPSAAIDHVAGAGRDEQSPAQAMIDLLWPATVGYFLDQLFAPEVSQATVDAVRAWMRQWVRPHGPLPALRVGPVPYGVLPVTTLGVALTPTGAPADDTGPAGLGPLLGRLSSLAVAATGGVPTVGGSADPDQDLIEVLGMDASARTVRIRRSLGYDATWNLFGYIGTPMTSWQSAQRAVAAPMLTAIGEATRDPRAAYLTFTRPTTAFAGPMVAEEPLSETDPLPFDYLGWLSTATPADLRSQTAPPSPQPVNALLYLMVRHALLAEYDRLSRRLLTGHGLLEPHESTEAELVAILPQESGAPIPPGARTAWDRFDVTIEGVTDGRGVGEYLADPTSGRPGTPADADAALAEVADLRVAIKTLSGLPTAQLDRLFTETLDVCSHRIDAWLTAVATERLATMRASTPTGISVGCYGWVENFHPGSGFGGVAVTLPDGSSTKAQEDAGGFVYAPSMMHAATAAVLRSGYLARSGPAQEPYTIDLSSNRVRSALALLDAVRDEQPLGAVLGAGFERGLHESHPGVELDRFIDGFRSLYPAVANKTEVATQPAETIAARTVVDGLALLLAWQNGAIPWTDASLLPTATQQTAIEAELATLANAVDSVSDLLLGESVFQVVKGSSAGAAATLDTLAKGQRPPEPEVVATPRGGTVLHQRVVVRFGTGDVPAAWADIPATPRSLAAPEVNAWLATLLGDPSRIVAAVRVGEATPREVTLADLGVPAIDLLLAVPQPGEVDARVVAAALGSAGPAPVGAAIAIDYDSASAGMTPLGAAVELLTTAAALLGYGRPLATADLLPPALAATPPADAMDGELDARANAAVTALGEVHTALATAVAGTDVGALGSALRAAAGFGLPGSFPPPTDDLGQLTTIATRAMDAATARLAAAATASSTADTLAAVFGPALPILPRFRPGRPDVLEASMSAEPDLGADPDATVEGWLNQLSRVRPSVAAWSDVRMFGRALEASVGLDRPRIAQLPAGTARWAGLAYGTEDNRPPSGLTSIAIVGPGAAAAPNEPWCGLLLDSWPEIIPSRTEEAGIAFHYDAPGAQAPQAVLLAVPRTATSTWSYDTVERTLLDTLALAKVRGLELSDLGAYGQFLPMTYLAANQANAAVSTSFHGLLVADAVIAAPSASAAAPTTPTPASTSEGGG